MQPPALAVQNWLIFWVLVVKVYFTISRMKRFVAQWNDLLLSLCYSYSGIPISRTLGFPNFTMSRTLFSFDLLHLSSMISPLISRTLNFSRLPRTWTNFGSRGTNWPSKTRTCENFEDTFTPLNRLTLPDKLFSRIVVTKTRNDLTRLQTIQYRILGFLKCIDNAPIKSKLQHPQGKTFEDWIVQIPAPWAKMVIQMPVGFVRQISLLKNNRRRFLSSVVKSVNTRRWLKAILDAGYAVHGTL